MIAMLNRLKFNCTDDSFVESSSATDIGSCMRYLNDMSNVYEHFDEDSVKWLPFVAINTFTNRMKELCEGIAAGVEGNTVSIEEYAKELNQELKNSIIIPEDKAKDYLPKEVKE